MVPTVARLVDSARLFALELRESPRLEPVLAFHVFAVSVVYHLAVDGVGNDHFDRVTRGWQILNIGDVPHRDFFDPGYFLTVYSSAVAQALFGHNLLGEMLLTTVVISLGFSLTFVLARRLSGSLLIASLMTAGAIVCEPRLYSYDKVFFFTLGIFLCWRCLDHPRREAFVLLGGVTALAALYRYDNALYVSCGIAGLLAVRRLSRNRGLPSELRWLTAGAAGVALPFLLFLLGTGAFTGYLDQAVRYALREGSRTGLFAASSAAIDWSQPLLGLADGASFLYPRLANRSLAVASLYWSFMALPWIALTVAVTRYVKARPHAAGAPRELSLIVPVALVAASANLFLLRDPVISRLGDVAAPSAVLGAWLLSLAADWPRREPRPRAAWRRPAGVGGAVVAIVLTWVCLVTVTDIERRIVRSEFLEGPTTAVQRLASAVRTFANVPPDLSLLPTGRHAPIVTYVRECTSASDRILVTWFAPELPFFAGRGFAGGVPMLFSDHWSHDEDLDSIIERLQAQPVPVVLEREGRENFRQTYDRLWRYLDQHYEVAATLRFPDEVLRVLVDTRREPSGTFAELGAPCFR